MFNSEQRAYMGELAAIPADKKCWCGWYRVEECRCERPKGQTLADAQAAACPECGNAPFAPGGRLVHLRYCSQNSKS